MPLMTRRPSLPPIRERANEAQKMMLQAATGVLLKAPDLSQASLAIRKAAQRGPAILRPISQAYSKSVSRSAKMANCVTSVVKKPCC